MLLLGYLAGDGVGQQLTRIRGSPKPGGTWGINHVREAHGVRQGLLMVLRVLSTNHHNQNGVWRRESEW